MSSTRLLDFAAEAAGNLPCDEAIEALGPTLGGWPAAANQDFSYGMAGNLDSLTRRGLLESVRNVDGPIAWRLP